MSVFNLTDSITCHAWNRDRSKVAICPNTNEIWIYSNCQAVDVAQWRKEAVLTEHDMVVSGLDWSPVHDMLVSCSHDRSAFVWKYEPSERKWKPSLVVLRITRAAMTVKWSPNGASSLSPNLSIHIPTRVTTFTIAGKKFAVGSSAKCVSVCYYEQAENWWISKVIKKHKSTYASILFPLSSSSHCHPICHRRVVDVDWHPNSQLLLTASTDMQCRVFAAYVPDVDGAPDAGPFAAMAPFGEVMAEFDNANAWVTAAVWSPSGMRLAFAGHGSSIHFVHFGRPGEVPTLQTVRFSHLPLTRLLFLSNDAVVGCGHDFNLLLFTTSPQGFWSFSELLDKKSAATTASKADKSEFNNGIYIL
ncbi:hypothetical protein DYB37_001124 [Aphanomyces astaci]|uniref:Arp2/3 complex 41 kDa subunit n=1 Tax=Aphanomyces astaci TaxID=112090 RepID=A0A418FAT8_APHAT|nr:hypothetical protein DYB35_007190 [Aphanomyces astaci]RHZ26536.1 hypothetical protein DYB37_001124 [Aphanomyces astaci]